MRTIGLAMLWLLATPALAQDQAATAPAASSAPAATADDLPPFPPPAIQGEAPDLKAPVDDPTADGGADGQQRNAPYTRPPPSSEAPSPRPPTPVDQRVRHARGLALVGAQLPIGLLWGGGVAATGIVTTLVLLEGMQGAWLPVRLLVAAVPLGVSLLGGAASVLATLGVLPAIDAVIGAPEASEEVMAQTALWSAIYASTIALVTAVPLSIPPLLAAVGVRSDQGVVELLAYASLAGLIPIFSASIASVEAASDAGYAVELPVWVWYMLNFCSLGTMIVF